MGGEGKTLYVRLASNVASFKGQMAQAGTSVAAFGSAAEKNMGRLGTYADKNKQSLRSLGNVAGGVGLVAAVGIGLAIKSYAEFDQQMSAVQAATHATKAEMAALREEAIKQGADTQYSAKEAGQGIEELAKAGIETADILGGGLKGALDLAAAGAIGVGEAAEIAATAMTQFGLQGDKIPHVADLLAAGAGKAQGSVGDLGSALSQSGLVASAMGLSIEETTGALSAFASAGMTGSDAGTSFKSMLQRLQAPMGRGAKAMEKYGISAYDTEGNFIGIANVAEQLRTKLAGLTNQQRDAALAQIFGSDAIRAATVLYKQGGEGIQQWIDKTNDAGYASETARLRTDNLAGDLERLGGSFETLFIGMGQGANGPMRLIVQSLEFLVDAAGMVPGPLKSAALAGLALTAALGLGVFAATRFMAAISSTRANIALLEAAAWRGAAAVNGMNKASAMKNLGKGAAMMAGFAIASGAAGDMMGLSNTAAFALMGTMGGPLGAAAGAAVGFMMDVAAATTEAETGFSKANKTFNEATTFAGQIKGLKGLDTAYANTRQQMKETTLVGDALSNFKVGFKALTGQDQYWETQAKQIESAKSAVGKYQGAVMMLEDRTVGARDGVNELFDPARMQAFASQVGPVLEKAGISLDQVLSEGVNGEHWGEAEAAINSWKAEADTAAGRADALGSAMAGVGDEMLTNADSADALANALAGLFAPAMDYDAATIAWSTSLRALQAELASGSKELSGNSEEAGKNRTAIMDSVGALSKRISTAAAAGESEQTLASMLSKGRAGMLDSAEAAGFSREKVAALLDTYGLTPELVQTLIEANGADEAKGEMDRVAVAAAVLDAVTGGPNIKPKGVPGAKGEIGTVAIAAAVLNSVIGGPSIRPKGVPGSRTQIGSVGVAAVVLNAITGGPTVATKGVPGAITSLGSVSLKSQYVNGLRARPSVNLNTNGIFGTLGAIVSQINSLDGRVATTTVRTVNTTVNTPGKTKNAYGSFMGGGDDIVPRYADGAMLGKSQPQIVRAGVPRSMWGEPETQGESYIPHAMDRRGRSTEILAKTAEKFGYDLTPRGMQAAGAGGDAPTVVVQQASRGPLVGTLEVGGDNARDRRDNWDEAERRLRKIDRGGRQW